MKNTLLLTCLVLLSSACNFPSPDQTSPSQPASDSPVLLATPHALQPAAGICGRVDDQTVEIFLEAGMPNPRCIQMLPEQFLTVTNRTGGLVTIRLAQEQAELQPEESYTFSRPLGEMLAPGVHRLQVDPCCGGEIMMVGQ
jgi:hypothetical protein